MFQNVSYKSSDSTPSQLIPEFIPSP